MGKRAALIALGLALAATPALVSALAIGDEVTPNIPPGSNLNVHSSASFSAQTVTDKVPYGSVGKIIDGPTLGFWDINWGSSGLSGWSVQSLLDEAPPQPAVAAAPTSQTIPSSVTSNNALAAAAATSIITCREITSPGTYVLANNIVDTNQPPPPQKDGSSPNTACIYIHDTNNVTLDCANYSITSQRSGETINVNNVTHFNISNCHLIGDETSTAVSIASSSAGQIENNVISGWGSYALASNDLQISGNTFTSLYSQTFTSGTVFENNIMSMAATTSAGFLFNSDYGANNKVIGNTMDGKSDGIYNPNGEVGVDDDIVLEWEENDLVQGNLLKNDYDCGIESTGQLSNTVIQNNTIQNMGVCGIGAWHYNSFEGNTIQNNTVQDVPELFSFYRVQGLWPENSDYGGAEQAIYFENNTFTNNKTLNQPQKIGAQPGYSSYISMEVPSAIYGYELNPGDMVPTPSQIILDNNLLKGNDFGTSLPLHLNPASMIVDGGGNICKSDGTAGFPLNCVNSSLPPSPRGYLDAASASSIAGWAEDQNNPASTLTVAIYEDSTLLQQVTANTYRSDLVAAGIGTGYYGYSIPTPSSICDGTSHQIHAYAITSAGQTELTNSPRVLTCGTSSTPTAKLLAKVTGSGAAPSTSITVNPLQYITFFASSTNAVSATTTLTTAFPDTCTNSTDIAFKATGPKGAEFVVGPVRPCRAGHTYTLTYTVIGTNGQSFSALPVTITVLPSPPTSASASDKLSQVASILTALQAILQELGILAGGGQ